MVGPSALAQTSESPPATYLPGQYPYPPAAGYPPPTAYAPGWVPAPPPEPPHPRRVFSLTISPLHLFLPVVELTGEARVHDNVGVAVVGGAGKYTDDSVNISATVYELGAQVRFYVLGDFRQGMQLGAELLYLHLNAPEIVATGEASRSGPSSATKSSSTPGLPSKRSSGSSTSARRHSPAAAPRARKTTSRS